MDDALRAISKDIYVNNWVSIVFFIILSIIAGLDTRLAHYPLIKIYMNEKYSIKNSCQKI